jgi:hypothetical protein
VQKRRWSILSQARVIGNVAGHGDRDRHGITLNRMRDSSRAHQLSFLGDCKLMTAGGVLMRIVLFRGGLLMARRRLDRLMRNVPARKQRAQREALRLRRGENGHQNDCQLAENHC